MHSGSGKSQLYAVGVHGKKQSASSGNLFVQQAQMMQLKLLESQAMNVK